MILLLAAAAITLPNLLEVVNTNADRIGIEALIKVPTLGAIDRAKLEVLTRTLPKGTLEYGRREMLMITDGEPVEAAVTPDVVRISVSVPKENLKPGLSLMDALLRDATLTQENLDDASAATVAPNYWTAALDPIQPPRVSLTQDEAELLYHRVFRPENLLLVVDGNFTSGTGQQGWDSHLEHWHPDPLPKGYPDRTAPKFLSVSPDGITTIDFVGRAIPSDDAALPARILSLFALGVGKGAELFRVVRERHAWSYRQEAILSPNSNGWEPRLLIAQTPSDDCHQRVDTIRSELLEDIRNWSESARTRALGMAEAVLLYGVGFNPFYVMGDAPVGGSLNDQAFLTGYWLLKTGKPWDREALLASMRQVSLEDLKAQASDLVTNAKAVILPGG